MTFLERTRRRIWGSDNPPGNEDPYTGESQLLIKEREKFAKVPKQDDIVTIGAAEQLPKPGDEPMETEADVREYERQARREERELFQQSVDDAPLHKKYVPKQTWDGMEMVGGEKEWDSGRRTFKG